MGVIVGFGVMSIFVIGLGIWLIWVSIRLRPSGGPAARIANLEGVDRVHDGAPRARSALRPLGVVAGLGLIVSPFLVFIKVTSGLGTGSKGRVLRIKNRAQLASPALGDGWSDDAPETSALAAEMARLSPAARAALGELWLLTARMEHASVAAFSQLALHLTALAAPARLLAASHRAALEEIRHARACFAIARAVTGQPHTAGPIAALGAREGAIDLARLAIGSLIDGCLAEGIAADVAARSSARAEEPTIRAVLAMIARDEAGHAEVAWDVLAWCLEQDPTLHAIVAARVAILDRELAPRLPDLPGASPATLARYGVIDQDALGALAAARIAAVQARARTLLPALALAA